VHRNPTFLLNGDAASQSSIVRSMMLGPFAVYGTR
jgi:hypothetical protein